MAKSILKNPLSTNFDRALQLAHDLHRRQPRKSTEALLVAFGDKIHNCRSIVRDLRRDGAAVWKRFEGRRDGTLWYYRELLEKFPREPYASLYDEFAAIVHALNEVAESC